MENNIEKTEIEKDTLIEQYKAYLDNVNEIGSQHTNTRAFYVSIISALLVFISLTGSKEGLYNIGVLVQVVVSIFAILLCIAWYFHIKSFGVLYLAKFDILRALEEIDSGGKKILYPIFNKESDLLFGTKKEKEQIKEGKLKKKKFLKFTGIESTICLLLIIPFALILIYIISYSFVVIINFGH